MVYGWRLEACSSRREVLDSYLLAELPWLDLFFREDGSLGLRVNPKP